MDTPKIYIHPAPSSHNDDTEPVDLVLSLLVSLLITATAFPLGILAALLHVLGTIVRNIPTCIMLAVGCVLLTSAVLLALVGYTIFWIGSGAMSALVELKKAVEGGVKLGTNMASIFADEFAKEKRKQMYERWGIRT
ncbi:transmembrane protein [Ceratobasidium sp. AG-Ba]|nr:transmembrane protein [Ceratobasidium sp. AG-Ba]QRW04691.1 transmembrane protein [Ceratobasidium sp. AG-Ba]